MYFETLLEMKMKGFKHLRIPMSSVGINTPTCTYKVIYHMGSSLSRQFSYTKDKELVDHDTAR